MATAARRILVTSNLALPPPSIAGLATGHITGSVIFNPCSTPHRTQSLRCGSSPWAAAAAVETAPETMKEVIAALQALRGIAKLSAVTIVAEVGQLSRFTTARQFMAYSGTIPSEYSSGASVRRGGITKTGNCHLRRVVIEAGWSQRFRPILSRSRKIRMQGLDPEVWDIADKAMHRLHSRYAHLESREKPKQKIITAVAREMLGFIWAIAVSVEKKHAA